MTCKIESLCCDTKCPIRGVGWAHDPMNPMRNVWFQNLPWPEAASDLARSFATTDLVGRLVVCVRIHVHLYIYICIHIYIYINTCIYV